MPDPIRKIQDLRDQLAAQDARIAFFFGAGTSACVKSLQDIPNGPAKGDSLIPAVAAITERCREVIREKGEKFAASWTSLEEECAAENAPINVETLLSRVRMKLDAIGDETLIGLTRDELQEVETGVTSTIGRLADPPTDSIPSDLPHAKFARWITRISRQYPVEVFTTNYDMLFERGFDHARCPYYDGFPGGYRPSFEMADRLLPPWTRVWKIHGSTNWSWSEVPGQRRVIRVEPNPSGAMILPSHYKYDESRKQPYLALLERLRDVLSREDTIMVASGFSFSDEHINETIFEGLSRSRRSHLFVLLHSDLPDDHQLVIRAEQDPKISVLGPKRVIAGGKKDVWMLKEPLRENLAAIASIAFKAIADEENQTQLTGEFLLGDFNRFCELIETMEP